jgi:hypothetical protein
MLNIAKPFTNIMKRLFQLFLCNLLFSFSIYGQTDLDGLVSINIPGEVVKLDTIIKNIRLLQYYSQNNTETYFIQKVQLGSKENELNNLPYDLNSLRKSYKDILDGQMKSMRESGYELRDSTEIKIAGYLAYNFSYNKKETGLKSAESNVIILNDDAYVATYFNETDFNEINRTNFLKSLEIDPIKKPSQMIGNSRGYKTGYIIGKLIFYGLLIYGFIYLIKKFKKK